VFADTASPKLSRKSSIRKNSKSPNKNLNQTIDNNMNNTIVSIGDDSPMIKKGKGGNTKESNASIT